MKFRTISRILTASLPVLLCISSATGGGRTSKSASSHAKARYFYLKGAVSEAEGDNAEAYEYYKKARGIDPSYPEASFAFGAQRMMLNEDTFASNTELHRNLEYMKVYLDAVPSDVTAGEEYAYYAAVSDTFPESIRVTEGLVKAHPGLSRLYLPLAYYYRNSGETEKAVQAMREYERLEGATTESLLRKITYYVTDGDTIAAISETDSYVTANPGPDALIQKAIIYNVLGRPEEAINILEDALKEYPDNGEMKYNIGVMYAERGDSVRFHQLIGEAFAAPDMEYEDKMAILRGYAQNLQPGAVDYTESDRLYEMAAKDYSDDPLFLEQYADYEIAKGDFPAAYRRLGEAMAKEPDNSFLLKRLVSLSIVAGCPEEGMKTFENFPDEEAKKDFDNLLAYVSAAQVTKNYDKAISGVEEMLRYGAPALSLTDTIPEDAWMELLVTEKVKDIYSSSLSYEIAGDIYAAMGRQADAVRSYENSLALDNYENASALNNYAYYIVETLKAEPGSSEFTKAKDMSRKSLELSEQYPNANYYDTYAWILFKERNYKDALDYQELAIEASGSNPAADFYSHYGDILFMNGRPDDAVEQWEKALELEPENKLLKKKVEHKTFFYE